MKISHLVSLAIVAVILFLLAVTAVHLDPTLASIISTVLVGIAAVINAINRTPTTKDTPGAKNPDPDSPNDPVP